MVMHCPWGYEDSGSGWKGRWSNGSKEWTAEWLGVLEVLGHSLGGGNGGGDFVMECEFLLPPFIFCFDFVMWLARADDWSCF